MSILDKISKGDWHPSGHFIRADHVSFSIGQAFIVDIPRHENKFAPDLEGINNAKVMAASKQMLSILIDMVAVDRDYDNNELAEKFLEIRSDAREILNDLNK